MRRRSAASRDLIYAALHTECKGPSHKFSAPGDHSGVAPIYSAARRVTVACVDIAPIFCAAAATRLRPACFAS